MAKNLHFKFAPRNKQTAEKVTLLGIQPEEQKLFKIKEKSQQHKSRKNKKSIKSCNLNSKTDFFGYSCREFRGGKNTDIIFKLYRKGQVEIMLIPSFARWFYHPLSANLAAIYIFNKKFFFRQLDTQFGVSGKVTTHRTTRADAPGIPHKSVANNQKQQLVCLFAYLFEYFVYSLLFVVFFAAGNYTVALLYSKAEPYNNIGTKSMDRQGESLRQIVDL